MQIDRVRHALTVDVEDFSNVALRRWLGIDGQPTPRVVVATGRFLKILQDAGVRGTFFILGEVAKTHPGLVRDIASGGHEIGIHGYSHRVITDLTADQFRDEVLRARSVVEDATGTRVRGHRAPIFSIGPGTSWALDVLAECGFTYDSSVFPFRGSRYGWPGFKPDIHVVELQSGRRIIEAPLATIKVLGRRLPVCGGGYVRHFPRRWTLMAMRAVARERPAITYFHPYELELEPPEGLSFDRLSLKEELRLRSALWLQMRNRHTVEGKLRELLRRFSFVPLHEVIAVALKEEAAEWPQLGH